MTEVLLPPELLAQSPSCRDGVDSTEELLHRAFGCELIQEGGILLRLPQVVMATAQNLFHRFFYRCDESIDFSVFMLNGLCIDFDNIRKSLKRFDVFSVAMGTLLLSSKIEEKPKILREVLMLFVLLLTHAVLLIGESHFRSYTFSTACTREETVSGQLLWSWEESSTIYGKKVRSIWIMLRLWCRHPSLPTSIIALCAL